MADYAAIQGALDPGSVLASVVGGTSGAIASGSGANFHINWRTDKAWSGTCRQLMMLLNDGTLRTATFQFI